MQYYLKTENMLLNYYTKRSLILYIHDYFILIFFLNLVIFLLVGKKVICCGGFRLKIL